MNRSAVVFGALVAALTLVASGVVAHAGMTGTGFRGKASFNGESPKFPGKKFVLDLPGKGGKTDVRGGLTLEDARLAPGLGGKGGKTDLRGGVTLEHPGLTVPGIEIPTLADIVSPKKIRCRAYRNRRGKWRIRGKDCKDLKPPTTVPEIRFDLEDCLVEVDRLGNRYFIGDDCPNEPLDVPTEDESDPEIPEIQCVMMVEIEVNGVPVWVPSEDGCEDPFDVQIPEPEVPEDFGNRCPEDYFHPSQFTDETKFAMPVHDEYGPLFPHPILPEPLVIHVDHKEGPGTDKLDCESYDGWHLCYDPHKGTDFMLAGHFLAMDNANVHARAAASGRVMKVVDGNFDRCEVDLDAFSDTFMEVICPNPDTPDSTSVTTANRVDICHPDGTISQYYHLMDGSIEVIEGQPVSCGDPLAFIGSSGMSSAPHLHFQVKKKNEDGDFRSVDPYHVNDDDSLWIQQNGGLPGTLPGAQCQ
ncbi:MAG: M23 family metallopeptidase [Candidatus Binatia bacterium]|nr:M23 family metallopeptidase [Candidatus Binatia bacterium]